MDVGYIQIKTVKIQSDWQLVWPEVIVRRVKIDISGCQHTPMGEEVVWCVSFENVAFIKYYYFDYYTVRFYLVIFLVCIYEYNLL